MFCPSCGSENTGLPYCNRCGANLGPLTQPPQLVQVNITKPILIIATTLAVFTLGGFGTLIGGALGLAQVLRTADAPFAVILLGMIVILTVDIFLVRQLSKLINTSLSSTAQQQTPRIANSTFPTAQLQQSISPRLQAAPSVTENTTRFFEPAHRTPSKTDELASVSEVQK